MGEEDFWCRGKKGGKEDADGQNGVGREYEEIIQTWGPETTPGSSALPKIQTKKVVGGKEGIEEIGEEGWGGHTDSQGS